MSLGCEEETPVLAPGRPEEPPDGPVSLFALCRACGSVTGPDEHWDLDDELDVDREWYDHGVPKLDHDDESCFHESCYNVGAFIAAGLRAFG